MDEEYIYERSWHYGVKIEEVTGGTRYKGKVWREIARQIYCENGKGEYRDIGHFKSGAPFLYGEDERISISHTEGCYVVATIKVSPESTLSDFSEAAALGVDVERADRDKVISVRERFLNETEEKLVAKDSVEANVIAWTCKEAMLKAGMDPAINWREDIVITALPTFENLGGGYINLKGERHDLTLFTLRSGDFIISVAGNITEK